MVKPSSRRLFVNKPLLIAAVCILIVATFFKLFSNIHTLFPSKEMKSLRQLEKSLDLPKPSYRSEDDPGCHTNNFIENDSHCTRNIYLDYNGYTMFVDLKAKLKAMGWKLQESLPGAKKDTNYDYKTTFKDLSPVCISVGYNKSPDDDTYVFILGPTDENCDSKAIDHYFSAGQ